MVHVVAVGTGLAVVTGLTKAAGPVPAWLGYLCGTTVVLASLAQLRVRVDIRDDREDDDEQSDDGQAV